MNEYYKQIKNKTTIEVKNVLEIGSRDGNDANLLKNFFGVDNNSVWVVEPNPIKVKQIKMNYPLINLIDAAISENEGYYTFNQVIGDENDSGTSSLLDRKDDWYKNNKVNKIDVKTITGKSLLKIIDSEVDVCKVDVEGLTYEVLNSFGEDLTKIKSFHVECEHIEIWQNQKLYDNVKELLINMGYNEIYFNYCNGHTIQSDSIWVLKKYLNE